MAPTPKKSNTGKIIAIIAAVFVLCCCGGIGIAGVNGGFESFAEGFQEGLEGGSSDAKVGDCVKQVAESTKAEAVSNLDVVSCSSADADGKVLGIVSGISESEFSAKDIEVICDAYPTVEQAYWEGLTTSGKVWCIGPVD